MPSSARKKKARQMSSDVQHRGRVLDRAEKARISLVPPDEDLRAGFAGGGQRPSAQALQIRLLLEEPSRTRRKPQVHVTQEEGTTPAFERLLFLSEQRRPPSSTLFPYTTLFR